MPDRKKTLAALAAFVAGYSLYRLWMIGGFPLSPDEAYYFAWSRVPAVSYYDQPGMVAWVDGLFALSFARPTAVTVRLGAVTLGALSILLAFWAYLQYRRDEREALAFSIVFSALPFSWLAGIIMIHDTALLPWLLLAYGFALRLARDDGRTADWLGFALALTGAMYAKLSAVMVSWGIILYMLWSPRGRQWFKRWPPYAAGALIGVLYLPVVLWNRQHDWINFKAVGELTATGPLPLSEHLGNFLDYVLSQPMMFSPVLGVVAFAGLSLAAGRAVRRRGEAEDMMPVCLALPVFLYFAQLALRAKVFGNWPGVAYFPVALLAAGIVFRRRQSGQWTGLFGRRVLAAGLALNLLLLGAASLHLTRRVFRPLFGAIEERCRLDRHLDWRLDLDFGGWDEAVQIVERERGDAIIITRRYQVASLLEFLLPDRPRVYSWNSGQRGNQWDLWPGPPPGRRDALFIDYKKLPKHFAENCATVEPIYAPLTVGDPRRPVKEWYVYRCRGWTGPLPAPRTAGKNPKNSDRSP